MAEKVPMTALSPTMEEGTITTWEKQVGDAVAAGDVLCEVETDKASMEYEAVQEGTLLRIVVEAGDTARVGQTIAIIGESGEDTSALESEIATEGASGAATAPDEPEEEQRTRESATAAEPESDTPESAASAPPSGTTQPASAATVAESRTESGRIKVSPLAVKLAAERNINLSMVRGTGTGGRIVKRDIESFRGAGSAPPAPAPMAPGAAPSDTVVPLTGRRKVIARRLSESKFSAPHYYLKTSVNMQNVMAARRLLNEALPSKVSLNAFFIKFAAEALKRHPNVNGSWQEDHILQFGSVDIGLAVDLGNGLITPVVRNCGSRGVVDIDGELKELIEKAGENRLKPDEYTGATFTISNLGSFGVEEFTAIINPPGSAILALGKTQTVPVVAADRSIAVADVMSMTLSCDHRVIDGAAGARFLSDLQHMMEEPLRLLF